MLFYGIMDFSDIVTFCNVLFSRSCKDTDYSSKYGLVLSKYKGADKSLARPGRKQATATENFDVRISYL
jgi:hypothetical protein